MATSTDNQTLGRGELHFSRFKPGTYIPAGFRPLGNAPAANQSITSEKLPHYDSRRGIKRKDKNVTLSTEGTLAMTLDDMQPENLAYFFYGDSTIVTQTSATAVVETFTDVTPGLSYQLGMSDANPTGVRSISTVLVKVASATKVLNTDYTIDAELGIVTILKTGSIAADADIEVTYDRAAKNREQVVSGTKQIEGCLRYIAYNPEGEDFDYLYPYVTLSSDGELPLIGEEWQQLSLTAELLIAPNRQMLYIDGRPYTPA